MAARFCSSSGEHDGAQAISSARNRPRIEGVILLENIASVALIAFALLGFGLWLAAADAAASSRQSRPVALALLGGSFVVTILNAIVGDWSLAVAFAVWGATETVMFLAPGLPERLHLREHSH
ncbi:MAG TPA: hypothetical protein VIV08_02535 [Acidimicrobiia bacterium]